jgi:hypothetical protein
LKRTFKEGFEHENVRKTPKRKTEIKMGTTGCERYNSEGRKKWEESVRGQLWEDR